ncbi:hypothetical protein JAAARDRAFT_323035 [Jaapia argillacea MUCL 33604]|uniref:Uncharacterized protein n=1 Tax=Jaapia argillacea MUCL 33604 TaxID=933084 RepID=A0A067P2N4_9AGAM|nr:hypothetical protein JAAARDRAFT_323035 [Jaapia argillacea MUCL 33604]
MDDLSVSSVSLLLTPSTPPTSYGRPRGSSLTTLRGQSPPRSFVTSKIADSPHPSLVPVLDPRPQARSRRSDGRSPGRSGARRLRMGCRAPGGTKRLRKALIDHGVTLRQGNILPSRSKHKLTKSLKCEWKRPLVPFWMSEEMFSRRHCGLEWTFFN